MKKRSDRALWRCAGAACLLVCLLVGPATAQTMDQQVQSQPYSGGGQQPSSTGMGLQGSGQNTGQAGGQAGATNPYGNALTGATGSLGGRQSALMMDVPQASSTQEIMPGDVLDVVVFDTPELSGRFRVNTQGDIVLPLVGALHVAGLNSPQTAEAVANDFRGHKVLLQPQVTVFIAEYAARGVTMSGEVRAPGIYPVVGPRTLNDMLALAGGLNGDASKTVSIVRRGDPHNITTVKLNVGAQTPESVAASNIAVQPGDTIFVARSGIVYVVGDLNRPGAYEVEHNDRLTLVEAVALAGGPTQTSKLWDARLIRRSQAGREEMKIDLKRILYGGGPDMLMADGDILYVPISQRRVYTREAIEGMIGVATAYGVFRLSQY
jgi:polysaccharide export outer membrane protein